MTKKTPLYHLHVEANVQLVEFAGTLLPVRFNSEKEEHFAVRQRIGMFDVSHMGEILVYGDKAPAFLNWLLSNNIEKLSDNQAHYSLLLNERGGIIDDLIVYKFASNKFLLCVNAANSDKDWEWIKKQGANFEVKLENASENFAQIAVQGPKAIDLLQTLCPVALPERFCFIEGRIKDIPCLIARTGYTGEDGVELFLNPEAAIPMWSILLEHGVEPCGLSARDSLRLEAGMLLHGNDMDENTTPLEAGISFAVDFSKEFLGKDALIEQTNQGRKKKLIGFRLEEKGIARHGFLLHHQDGHPIGEVSSGTWPPTQEHAIGLAYITDLSIKTGDAIFVAIRNRMNKAIVVKPRFL